ncbi:MAG: TMEM165/GDT1 family protein [Chloroflexi bacterium]|nr:TMEM165/GDT1 family protein [Chloroflexota bacterium]
MILSFSQSLFFIAIAEMGDKSQLVSLAFATRFRPAVVLAGVFTATLAVHLMSVALGRALDGFLPEFWIALAAGFAFIGFGVWTLRGDKLDSDTSRRVTRWGPFMAVTATFFVAEIGDKTMLATVTLAARDSSFVGVWLGSTVGMVLADALAIWVGMVLGKRLPERAVKLGAAGVFIITGVITIALAFNR